MDVTIKIENQGQLNEFLTLLETAELASRGMMSQSATVRGRLVRATTTIYRALDDAAVYSDESAFRTTEWLVPLRSVLNKIRNNLGRAPIHSGAPLLRPRG